MEPRYMLDTNICIYIRQSRPEEVFTSYDRRNIKIDSWLEQYRARGAMEAALERMQRLFGKTEVPWGQVNVTIRGGTFPMDGTGLYDVLHPDDGPEQSNGQILDNDGWGT
jgi:hypothetical protein